VYKHYNQEQLNDQYNTRLQVPGYADYFERWERLSRQTEKEHTIFKNIFFGTHPGECVDIFPAEKKLAKTMVFIHGGYWHLLDKSLFHFLAQAFLRNNITTVFINYPPVPASMDMIISSCHKAMMGAYVCRNGDPSQHYIMGHSAGDHLAL
jgi:arylformamidase